MSLYQRMLYVVLQFVSRCWVYQNISSLLSHLWCVYLSPQSFGCLVCAGCCGVEIPQFFRRDVWSAQIWHTHTSRLIGMAIKIRYMIWLSTLASVQNLARSHIDAFPAAFMCFPRSDVHFKSKPSKVVGKKGDPFFNVSPWFKKHAPPST